MTSILDTRDAESCIQERDPALEENERLRVKLREMDGLEHKVPALERELERARRDEAKLQQRLDNAWESAQSSPLSGARNGSRSLKGRIGRARSAARRRERHRSGRRGHDRAPARRERRR